MDTHLNYDYFKISVKLDYRPLTFLYVILFPCQSRRTQCSAWQAQLASVERRWQLVGFRGGLCEGTPGAAPYYTVRSADEIPKKGQKTSGGERRRE